LLQSHHLLRILLVQLQLLLFRLLVNLQQYLLLLGFSLLENPIGLFFLLDFEHVFPTNFLLFEALADVALLFLVLAFAAAAFAAASATC